MRTSLRWLLFPILGVASAVGLAWGFAIGETSRSLAAVPASEWALLRGVRGGTGADEFWLLKPTPGRIGGVRDVMLGACPAGVNIALVRVSGWPLRAMRCGRYLRADGTGYDDWGMIRLGGRITNGRAFDAAVPVSVLWWGLAADSAIFAVGWWVVLGGAMRLSGPGRRKRRRKLGLCPMCGYDLLADFEGGCPECGWNRKGTEGEATGAR